ESVLSNRRNDKSSDACYPARRTQGKFLKNVHREMLPVPECRRYGASVGFCNATTEMMRAHSFEVAPKSYCRITREIVFPRSTISSPHPPKTASVQRGLACTRQYRFCSASAHATT